jgi:hypothetical protein
MGSRANSIYLTGVKAGADLTGQQYNAVKLDAAGDVVVAGAGELAIGVLQNAPNTGEAASVVALGGALAVAGGSIDEGAFLKVDAAGDLVATTTDKDFYVARAIKAAADNDIFEVFVSTGFYAA